MTLSELIPQTIAIVESIFAADAIPVIAYNDPDYAAQLENGYYDPGVVILLGYDTSSGKVEALTNHISLHVAESRNQNKTGKTALDHAIALLGAITAPDEAGNPSNYYPANNPIESHESEDDDADAYFINLTTITKN